MSHYYINLIKKLEIEGWRKGRKGGKIERKGDRMGKWREKVKEWREWREKVVEWENGEKRW